jgi:hypothetical protein
MTKSGINIRRIINIENDESRLISSLDIVKYSNDELYKSHSRFEQLLKQNILFECNFHDNTWNLNIFNDNKRIKNITHYKFQFDNRSELNTALKCYILLKLHDARVEPATLKHYLKRISDVLEISNFFDINFFDDTVNKLQESSDSSKHAASYAIKEFMQYYNCCWEPQYYEYFTGNASKSLKANVRALPNYYSILLFDFMLDEFFSQCSEEDEIIFYPILLWWRITKIIPMRPREFVLTKINCCYQQKNEFYFTRELIKHRKGINTITVDPLMEIKINEETFRLIQRYLKLTEDDEREYLLSFKAYLKSKSEQAAKLSELLKINENFLDRAQLQVLLELFYKKIIEGKYRYKVITKEFLRLNKINSATYNKDGEIIMLNLGDTRHLAFCSMMLQGFNPLTIAKIGGHSNLESQNHYVGHLDTFVQSSIYRMSRKMYNDEKDIYRVYDKRLTVSNKKETLIKVENGYCLSENFPIDCEDIKCIYCTKFRLNFKDSHNLNNFINELSKEMESEINDKIEFIKLCINNGEISEEQLKMNSSSLKSAMMRKAKLESYCLKASEVKLDE